MFDHLLAGTWYIHFQGLLPSDRIFAWCKIHFTSKSCVLLYWQRYCAALQQQASAKLCGVVQGMELPNFCGWRHPYSIGRPSRWAAAHILVQSYCCPVCMQSKVKSPEKIWYIAYCLHILHIVYDAVTASCSVVAVGLLKIAIERLNSQDNTNMNNTHTQTSANHKLEKYNQEIFKIWLKFSYSNSGELQDNICYTMHRRQLCKAKKYWGSTILSPQYLEKYWGKCPHCPYGVGAYAAQ